jgi:hypothetical protein
MSRRLNYIVLLIGLIAAAGCSREAEKDKYKDLDRPTPAATPKGN